MNELEQKNSGASPVEISSDFGRMDAGERIRLLREIFPGRLVASTSFGIQSALLLDLISRHAPEIPVVFIDTGFLFDETYRYAEELTDRFGTDLRVYLPALSAARLQALHGNLWKQGKEGADRYATITKIEPMNRALREIGADVWVSGLRRVQSKTRADRPFVEKQKRTLKAYPILDWTDEDASRYFSEAKLPPHPLAERGYVTMGDWHSTRPIPSGGAAEDTRFGGTKYECGLHLDSGSADFQI